LTISAAIASKIFANSNTMEKIQEGGEEGVAKVQQSYPAPSWLTEGQTLPAASS